MKLWMKAAVFASVGLFLYFGHTVYDLQSRIFLPDAAYLAPLTIPPPLVRREVTTEVLLEKMPGNRQVFRQVFFEIMTLRGMQKSHTGEWLALFADAKGRLIRLGPGDTYDGVTIASTNSGGCTARYGSIERNFSLAPGAITTGARAPR